MSWWVTLVLGPTVRGLCFVFQLCPSALCSERRWCSCGWGSLCGRSRSLSSAPGSVDSLSLVPVLSGETPSFPIRVHKFTNRLFWFYSVSLTVPTTSLVPLGTGRRLGSLFHDPSSTRRVSHRPSRYHPYRSSDPLDDPGRRGILRLSCPVYGPDTRSPVRESDNLRDERGILLLPHLDGTDGVKTVSK